jgi:hypothetical protein
MRHLLNTYVQADAASNLGDLGGLSLTELRDPGRPAHDPNGCGPGLPRCLLTS